MGRCVCGSVCRSAPAVAQTAGTELARALQLGRVGVVAVGTGIAPSPTVAQAQERQRRADERETQTERITRSVNIGASGEIDLANIAGDIVITRASGTTALIEAIKTARGATAEEAREMLALVPVEITGPVLVDPEGNRRDG